LTTSIMKTKSRPISDETTVVDRHELSHEDRINMIKQLLISGVAGQVSDDTTLHINGTGKEFHRNEPLDDAIQYQGTLLHSLVSFNSSASSCTICQLLYQYGENLSVNPYCNHIFHERCLLKWLARFNKCPSCRETFLRSI
jgi:hypothetical protein